MPAAAPPIAAPLANFSQAQVAYKIQINPGISQSTTRANTFTHDEFGFALLSKLADGSGYLADIYKVSTAKAGTCKITFSPRAIMCQAI